MKKLFLIFFVFIGIQAFAQEGVKVEGNTITIKETTPVWPGCENNSDKDECFNKMFMQHLKKTYKYPKNDKGEYIRGKATVSLEINEKGKAVVKSIEGKHPEINAEVKKMVEAMPIMKPGMRGGKPVAIKYTIPLNF
ncbi:energy transducer TonB [Christiangramia fulva]|uniref:Energy transducer TonB n=1 Tax=Christiangramia fulva TaxID=2126553 RepID=A0A2R3Z5A0_9FLAO|nr:energy transducer TonB [Christiangramia fulva]AVR45456.1 energy transducer TonB [Christiangramia fulva]